MQPINTFTYDELNVGLEFSLKKKITADLISEFSSLTGDHHPFHTDNNFAKENSLDGVIAHGMLISSFASALVGMQLPGKNMILLSQSFDYVKPVYPNETILIIGTLTRKIDPLKIILIGISIRSEIGEVVSKGEIKIKVLK
jgi:3-hydroxybutyryl-CoA dehydratase